MIQLLTDWVGESGWLWKISFQFRGMNVPGELLTAWGRITAKEMRGIMVWCGSKSGLRNDKAWKARPAPQRLCCRAAAGRRCRIRSIRPASAPRRDTPPDSGFLDTPPSVP